MTSGIYAIENTKNGKVYFGQSVNIKQRWSLHRSHLNRGIHRNRQLQAAWNEDGAGSFEFRVLEQCEPEQLNDREQHYLDTHMKQGNCYNVLSESIPTHIRTAKRKPKKFRVWVTSDDKWVASVKAYTDSINVPMSDWVAEAMRWAMEDCDVELVFKPCERKQG